MKLPSEILQDLVSFCDFTLSTAPNKDFLFINRIRRNGKRRIRGPPMPAVRQTCRTLQYISSVAMFEGATIELLHSDIETTLDWFMGQHSNALRGISGLRIELQRRRPANYYALGKVCRILMSMPRLKALFLGIPIEGDEDFTADPEPGLANALRWHWKQVQGAVSKDYTAMRGYGWDNRPGAKWVRDLLLVDLGQLTYFKLGTMRRRERTGVKAFLEKAMLEPLPIRKKYVEELRKDKRNWTVPPSFAGLAKYVEKMKS